MHSYVCVFVRVYSYVCVCVLGEYLYVSVCHGTSGSVTVSKLD